MAVISESSVERLPCRSDTLPRTGNLDLRRSGNMSGPVPAGI